MNLEDFVPLKTNNFIKLHLPKNPLLELVWDESQLAIKFKNDPLLSPLKLNLINDFNDHKVYFYKNSVYKENLARALGLKKAMAKPRILDATLGMGKDAVMMLAMELSVRSWERNPWIYLLQLNYREVYRQEDSFPWDLWEIYYGELEHNLENFDVIYFDPMYDQVSKKSLPKKNMRIFREAFDADLDAKEKALKYKALAQGRLVIKRPKKAEPLLENPSHQIIGKSTRFDIYLKA